MKFLSSFNKIASSSNMRKRCVKNSKFTIKDKRKKSLPFESMANK